MTERPPFDPDFVDWDAYADGVYTPAPALTMLSDYDSFWRTLGGKGDGMREEGQRQREAARALGINLTQPPRIVIDAATGEYRWNSNTEAVGRPDGNADKNAG